MMGGTEASFGPLLILVVAGVAWYAVNRALFDDLLSPFSLLFVGWIMPLVLQAMNLSIYEKAWEPGPSMMVVWVTVALTGTCLLAAPLVRARVPDARARARFQDMAATLRSPSFLLAFFAVYVLSFSTYVYAEFITNPIGIPLLAALEGRLTSGMFHRWGKDTRWSILSALLLILTPMAYAAYRANRQRTLRSVLLFITALFPVMAVFKLTRSDLFASAIGIGAVAFYFRRFGDRPDRGRRQVLRIVLPALLTIVIFYVIMGIRLASVGHIYGELTGFRIPGRGPVHGLAAMVYGYTALPFDNLNRFLSAHDGSYHLGISVFRPFLSVSGWGELADRLNAAVDYPAHVSGAAGNDTFLTVVYAELGLLGVVAVPIAYAALVSGLYVRMRSRPTLGNVFLYVNFLYPWLWLFFNNGFGVLGIYLNAMFVIGVSLFASELRLRRRGRSLGALADARLTSR